MFGKELRLSKGKLNNWIVDRLSFKELGGGKMGKGGQRYFNNVQLENK